MVLVVVVAVDIALVVKVAGLAVVAASFVRYSVHQSLVLLRL
tara:strand:+ start:157 stop:282 length:126 start_codon:yes stop_codon:yes gene_type:complete